MTAQLIDGKAIAAEVTGAVQDQVRSLPQKPGLAVILAGEDPASQVYVASKGKKADQLGFAHWQIDLPGTVSQGDLLAQIARLNADPRVHGILVQSPFPKHVSAEAVIDAIDPRKDVDGFHPLN